MSDDLTNQQIALLCDIGEFKMPDLTTERKRDLEHLISVGYVAPTEGDARTAFTLKLDTGSDFSGLTIVEPLASPVFVCLAGITIIAMRV